MEIQQNWAVVIHAKVLLAKDISPNQKLLLGLISNLTNIEGECYASNEYLSNLLDCHKMNVSKMITDLAKKGYLKIELFYKENSKEIEKRIIIITMQFNKGGIVKNAYTPVSENAYTPISRNAYENNTLYSNTLHNTNTLLIQKESIKNNLALKTKNTIKKDLARKFDFDELLVFGKSEIEKLNLDFSKYEYSLRTKLETWQESGWKDGHGKPIKNPKMKIKNTIPYLKAMDVPQKPKNLTKASYVNTIPRDEW